MLLLLTLLVHFMQFYLNILILVIILYELMTVGTFFTIAAGRRDSGPAIRYACVHFFVGVILIAGLALQNTNLIILGLLINCSFSFFVLGC